MWWLNTPNVVVHSLVKASVFGGGKRKLGGTVPLMPAEIARAGMSSESGGPRSLFDNMPPLLSLKRKLTRPPGLGEEGVLKGNSLISKGIGVVDTVMGLLGVCVLSTICIPAVCTNT